MRRCTIPFLYLALIAGCAHHGETIRGKAPEGTARSISSVKEADASAPVTVRGTMVEK